MNPSHSGTFTLLLLLLVTLSLLTTVSPALAKGAWVLEDQWTEDKPTEDNPDKKTYYHSFKVKTGDGSGTISMRFGPGSHKETGSAICQGSWTAPPDIMNPGEKVHFTFHSSIKGQDSRGGYYLYHGCDVSCLRITTLNTQGKVTSSTGCGIKLCKSTIGGGKKTSDSCSLEDDWQVPNGSPGSGIIIYVGMKGYAGIGQQAFKYIYKDDAESPAEISRKKQLLKKWDFWQDEYRSYENDLIISLKKKQEKMREAKVELERIKKSYESLFGSPFPKRDYTITQYPTQTTRQRDALRIYEDFKRISEKYEAAEERENDIIIKMKEFPAIMAKKEEIEAREAATREKERLKEDLNHIKKEWANKYHTDYGPLKKAKKISDPQHQTLDNRLTRRQVDEMEYKIKNGAYFENGNIQRRAGSNTALKFSKSPEQNQVGKDETNIAADGSGGGKIDSSPSEKPVEEGGWQSIGKGSVTGSGHEGVATKPSTKIPKGHSTKYGF